MTKIRKLIEDALVYALALKAKPEPLSPEAEKAIDAALAETFGNFTIISERRMKVEILRFVHGGRMTGSEIIDRLAEMQLGLKVEGNGAVLGLLRSMERENLLSSEFDHATKRKWYSVSKNGLALLTASGEGATGGVIIKPRWNL